MKALISVCCLLISTWGAAQNFIKVAPFGKDNCLKFVAQARLGNIVAVEAEDGTPYKVKFNKLDQIEWVIEDPSVAMYSMKESYLLLGAHVDAEGYGVVTCRTQHGDMLWQKTLDEKAYSFTFLEVSANEFLVGGGDGSSSFIYKMNDKGIIAWKTVFRPTMHHHRYANLRLVRYQEGFLASAYDWDSEQLYFIYFADIGRELWRKRYPLSRTEGSHEMYLTTNGEVHVFDQRDVGENRYSVMVLDEQLDFLRIDTIDLLGCLGENEGYISIASVLDFYDEKALTAFVRDYKNNTTLTFLYPERDHCFNTTVFYDWDFGPYQCFIASDPVINQRGQSFIGAIQLEDELGTAAHIINFDMHPDYFMRRKEVVVRASDLDCITAEETNFFDGWTLSLRSSYRNFSVPHTEESLSILSSGGTDELRIASDLFGYEYCVNQESFSDHDVVEYLVYPSEGSGLGFFASVPASKSDSLRNLEIKYWNFGSIPEEKNIHINAPAGLHFEHENMVRKDDTTWLLTVPPIEPFSYESVKVPFTAIDSIGRRSIGLTTGDSTEAVFSKRSIRIPDTSSSFQVTSLETASAKASNGDRLQYVLTFENTGEDHVYDLRFYNKLNNVDYNSLVFEQSSHPIESRIVDKPWIGSKTVEVAAPGINLAPGESFYTTFSISADGLSCQNAVSNQIVRAIDYNQKDTFLLTTYAADIHVVDRDTMVSQGDTLLGVEVYSDTTIQFTLPNDAGCDTLMIYHVSTTTTNHYQISNQNVQIYPNPTTDILSIESLGENGVAEILDTKGNVVMSGIKSKIIDVRHLVPGVYFVRIENKNNSLVGSLIKI